MSSQEKKVTDAESGKPVTIYLTSGDIEFSVRYEIPSGVVVPERFWSFGALYLRDAAEWYTGKEFTKAVLIGMNCPDEDCEYWDVRIDAWFSALCAEANARKLASSECPPSLITAI